MWQWICGNTLRERIRNEHIHNNIEIFHIEGKQRALIEMVQANEAIHTSAQVGRCERLVVNGISRSRDISKLTWIETIKKDMEVVKLTIEMTLNKTTHVADCKVLK